MNTLSYERSMLGRWAGIVLQDTYRLGRQIGRGAMGEVYEAGHSRLPGTFAVKVLHPELVANREAFARFCREAEIMSSLRHPHIVQIFDFNTAPNGLPYFVMEYLEGVDLEARLAETGPLPLAKATAIVEAVASALEAAHARGIIHRDLKPANIFLTRTNKAEPDFVKVLDFGISKIEGKDGERARDGAGRLSRTGQIFGTPQFMAPEQALGHLDQVDGRTDQFALATIAYEMLTGEDAFEGDDPPALLYQVVHENPRPLAKLVSWDPGPLQAVLDRALAKERSERYPSMGDFARAFREAADAMACGLETTVPARVLERPVAVVEDAPPPVRAEPAVLRPDPVALPTVPVARRPERAVLARDVPAVVVTDERLPAIEEWDLPSSIDRVPVSPVRAIALAAVAFGLAALVIVKGWHRELVDDLVFARENLAALTKRPVLLRQPAAPQVALALPAPAQAAPAAAAAEPAEGPSEEAAASDEPPARPAEEPARPAATEAQAKPQRRPHRAAPARRQHRRAEPDWPPPLETTSPPPSPGTTHAPPSPSPLPLPGGFTIAPPPQIRDEDAPLPPTTPPSPTP